MSLKIHRFPHHTIQVSLVLLYSLTELQEVLSYKGISRKSSSVLMSCDVLSPVKIIWDLNNAGLQVH